MCVQPTAFQILTVVILPILYLTLDSVCPLWFLSVFAKLRKATELQLTSLCPSVRPHGTTRLPLDGFLWNLIFRFFPPNICRENSSFIKIRREYLVLYMTFPHLWQYLADFFLEWEIFKIKVVEKIKTHTLSIQWLFSPENRAVYKIKHKMWWSHGGHKWRHNMAHTRCMLDKQGYTHAHAHAQARGHPHTY